MAKIKLAAVTAALYFDTDKMALTTDVDADGVIPEHLPFSSGKPIHDEHVVSFAEGVQLLGNLPGEVKKLLGK